MLKFQHYFAYIPLGIFLSAVSSFCSADILSAEIKSGKYCRTELVKRLKLVEKTAHQPLKIKPSGKLLAYAASGELMCPWGLQLDFNGDKKNDWVGYLKLADQYQLVAYTSNTRNYLLQVISSSSQPPKNSYITRQSVARIKNKNRNQKVGKYVLLVNDLTADSIIYAWNGKKFIRY